jgi:hypothetical protein
MIKKANQFNEQKRFRVLISGVPGIAKSTTALSSPDPLMIDADFGWDRVPAQFRKGDYIQPKSYDELLLDLTIEGTKTYQTFIFDTGGALLNLMKAWAIKRDPKNGQRDGATLSMKGYGTIGQEFSRLMDYCFYTLQKHIVVVFHVKEEMDGDQKVFRLDVEGQTRNNIWKNMDLGGFMEASGERRMIGFSPTERYFAKGTHGVSGIMEIPNVMKGANNDFIQNLFSRVNNNILEEVALVSIYDDTMKQVKEIIGTVTNAESANKALESISSLQHQFASKTESWILLKEKSEACGLEYKDKTFQVKK